LKEKQYTKLFVDLLEKRGWKFRESTTHEDMHEHIDGHVTVCDDKGKAICRFSVDLKGDKYTSRRNEGIEQYLCQYVEFLNVRGSKGWLFGKADYIVILNEEQNGFYVVARQKIIKFCEELFKVNLEGSASHIRHELNDRHCWTESVECAMHKLYRRYNRPDEAVCQINMDDIKSLVKMEIK
jgi:hypothetical protein